MRNAEIAARLEELATLYELDGAIQYRVIAYRQAAAAIADAAVSAADMARQGRLQELPGIGKTLEEKVRALLDTGEIPAAAKLKEKYPPSLLELTRVPGLGAKSVRRLHEELGVTTLDELREACEQERVREVRGLGPKAEENILRGVAVLEQDGESGRRHLLSQVLPVAEELVSALRQHPASERVEAAGSVRRWTDTCKDIDLIATAADPPGLVEALCALPLVEDVLARGDAGAKVETHQGVAVDLRIVAPDQFGNLLQHFTGSAQHNVQLREEAVRRGFSVSEYGVEAGGTTHRCATEEEVYELLGYAYVEPELREGRGELQAAREDALPELVTIDDVCGDLHCHTTLSDGRNTLREMARAARKRGYRYLAVTDHSASHGFGDNVTPAQLERRIREVRELNAGARGFRVLAGSEVNIGVDGSLDYADELLAELDWVVASVHTSFGMGEGRMTSRIVAAMEHPLVDCIGHPTGRLIGRRDPYAVDVERVVEAARETGTMIEINGNPNRRDLDDRHARLAAEAGVPIVLNTDAHGVDTLANMRYAVATARRAWLTRKQVANARPWRDLTRMRKPERRASGPGRGSG